MASANRGGVATGESRVSADRFLGDGDDCSANDPAFFADATDAPGPALAASCTDGAIAATPGIRLESFARRFADRWVMTTTCSDWTNALIQLAGWGDSSGYPCWEGALRDVDREAPGLQPSCAAWIEFPGGGEVVVPACDAGGAGTWCFRMERDEVNCGSTPSSLALVLDPPGVLEPSTLVAECEVN